MTFVKSVKMCLPENGWKYFMEVLYENISWKCWSSVQESRWNSLSQNGMLSGIERFRRRHMTNGRDEKDVEEMINRLLKPLTSFGLLLKDMFGNMSS